MAYATPRIKGCLCWINYSVTCYSLVWKYFKKQMLNTTLTSMSICHVYFMKEKRAGKLHKPELVSTVMGILSLMPNIDWIIESRILPAAPRDSWDFSSFPFRPVSFHTSHERDIEPFIPFSSLHPTRWSRTGWLLFYHPLTLFFACSGSLVLCF